MAKAASRPNTLYYGDNLDVLRQHIEDESVDLIYLDPPFQSGRDYNLLYTASDGKKAPAQIKAFEDTWEWDEAASSAYDEVVKTGKPVALALESFRKFIGGSRMLAYMSMMSIRLVELQRVLKKTGSLYLHCDPNASHYLKIVLDAIFGPQNFRSEISWKRYGAHGNADRSFGAVHDVILFYAKSDEYQFHKQFVPYTDEYAASRFRHVDEKGRRYQEQNLSNPSPRPNLRYPYKASNGVTYQPHKNGWKCDLERMKQLDAEGRLHFPKDPHGRLRLRMYLDECEGVPLGDVWTDITLPSTSKERLGYPTQKPVALLERILSASSNPGDVVLDPFCGCGTTIHAAHRLKRRWIGIDITHLATGLIKSRLRDEFGDIVAGTYRVVGEPTDLEGAQQLALDDRFQFEQWALGLIGARSNDKGKGADKGIDGVLSFQEGGPASPLRRIMISVKSGAPKATDVRDLRGVIEREQAAIGVLIVLSEPTKPQRKEAADAGMYTTTHLPTAETFPRLQIITIEELLDGARIKAPATIQRKPAKRASSKQLSLKMA